MKLKLDIYTYVSGVERVSGTVHFNLSTNTESYRVIGHILTGGRRSIAAVFDDVRDQIITIFSKFDNVNRKNMLEVRREVLWQADTAINRAVEGCLHGTTYEEKRTQLYTILDKGAKVK